jgi:hypothetical protein
MYYSEKDQSYYAAGKSIEGKFGIFNIYTGECVYSQDKAFDYNEKIGQFLK